MKENAPEQEFYPLAVNVVKVAKNYSDFFDLQEIVLFEWFIQQARYWAKYKGVSQFYLAIVDIASQTKIKKARLATIIKKFEGLGIIESEVKFERGDWKRVTYYTLKNENIIALIPKIYRFSDFGQTLSFFRQTLPENGQHKEYTVKNIDKEKTLKGSETTVGKNDFLPERLLSFDFESLKKKYGIALEAKALNDNDRQELLTWIDQQQSEKEKNSAKKEKPWHHAGDFNKWFETYLRINYSEQAARVMENGGFDSIEPQYKKQILKDYDQDRLTLKTNDSKRINEYLNQFIDKEQQEAQNKALVAKHMNMLNNLYRDRLEMFNSEPNRPKVKVYAPLPYTLKDKRLLGKMVKEFTESQIRGSFMAYIDDVLHERISAKKIISYFVHYPDNDFDVAKTYLNKYIRGYEKDNPNYKPKPATNSPKGDFWGEYAET